MSHFLINLLKRIQRKYPNKTLFFKILRNNFLLATSVVVSLYLLENTAIIKEIKDMALDQMMFWHSDFEPTLADGQKMQRMALFDIDEFSYRAWDSPLITPRDQLQGLIQMAINQGAKVIAVDIGLSRTSDGYIKDHATQTLSPMDEQLARYLQKFNENKGPNAPLIFLTRTYRQPLDKYGAIQESAFLETPPSFLENFLPIENNVFWSSTFFTIDEDRVIRRWNLARLVCQNGHLQVVPSMQLLVALAYLHTENGQTQPAAQIIRDFKTQWNQWAKQFSCQEHQGKTLTQLCQLRACPDWQITLPAKARVSDTVHHVDLREGYESEIIKKRKLISKVNDRDCL
jgi:CHASE2 domain-containing sensor protein